MLMLAPGRGSQRGQRRCSGMMWSKPVSQMGKTTGRRDNETGAATGEGEVELTFASPLSSPVSDPGAASALLV